jgi:peroxiredoxin Q/BCP
MTARDIVTPMKWVLIAFVLLAGLLLWRTVSRARTPRVGDEAPGFSLSNQHGVTRALGDFRGKWLVLYFFPRADTPG